MRVLTPAQMRDADTAACEQVGDDALMRAAGLRIAERVRAHARGGRVIAFAGPGNNGGDAFAALAELPSEYERIVYAMDAPHLSDARRAAEQRARAADVIDRPFPKTPDEARAAAEDAIVLDGLVGTGARLPLAPEMRPVLVAIDARERSVIAIDIPSGVDALTGEVGEFAVRATETVALGALKPGLLLETARANVGELWLGEIGMPPQTLASQRRTFDALDDAEFLAMLPVRALESDKRSAGAPLIVAGSTQFPGAAVLCARGAARAGAGYVTVVTPSSAAPTLRTHLVEKVVVAIDEAKPTSEVVDELLDLSRNNGSIAIGPGLGLDDRTCEIVRGIISQSTLPMVVDASALFHLAKHLNICRGKQLVITPHAGEFARLSGEGTVAPGSRVDRLRAFVERTGVVTLLKGLATLVYDGTTMFINTTGTNALATAGTGDVLTGMIATLLSQGLSPFDAARTGAYWHGLAGQYCTSIRSRGVTAGDLPDTLAFALPPFDAPHDDATALTRVF